jgi:hypothetical protein
LAVVPEKRIRPSAKTEAKAKPFNVFRRFNIDIIRNRFLLSKRLCKKCAILEMPVKINV